MNNTHDVIIIGGGVMGCATAYYLLKFEQGLKV
ncbi:MAG: FAD-dependent oxidoreductase [Chloroflexota bacterium]